jgi:hypothetical protein
MERNLSEAVTGRALPRSFILDYSTVDDEAHVTELRGVVQRNLVEFEFPDGLSQVDLLDECRAMTQLDDFDTVFDLTMQMISGKPVTIWIKGLNGTREKLCEFFVTNPKQDLRGVPEIDQHPYLVVWLTEYIGGLISKKFPAPGTKPVPQASAQEKSR